MEEPEHRQQVLTAFTIGVLAVQQAHVELSREQIDAITDDFLNGFLASIMAASGAVTIDDINEAFTYAQERKNAKTA
jgi:hypothetical protein